MRGEGNEPLPIGMQVKVHLFFGYGALLGRGRKRAEPVSRLSFNYAFTVARLIPNRVNSHFIVVRNS